MKSKKEQLWSVWVRALRSSRIENLSTSNLKMERGKVRSHGSHNKTMSKTLKETSKTLQMKNTTAIVSIVVPFWFNQIHTTRS